MKHILNDLTEDEKNSIREQHTGGMKIMVEGFNKLINSKLGEIKPLVNEQDSKSEGRNNPNWVNLVSKLKTLTFQPKVLTFMSYDNIPSQSLNWGTAKGSSGNYGFGITSTDSKMPKERMDLFNSNDRKNQMEMHNWWKNKGYETNGNEITINFKDSDKLKKDIEEFFKSYPPEG